METARCNLLWECCHNFTEQMETDTASRERTIARNTILEKCQEVMPAVQRKLAFSPEVNMSRSRRIQHEGQFCYMGNISFVFKGIRKVSGKGRQCKKRV